MGTVMGTIILLVGVGIIMVGSLEIRFFGVASGLVGLAILLRAQQKK